MQHTSIRVGQHLRNWDGTRGYVALNSQGNGVVGPGESFLVEWLGLDGKTVEDSAYDTLEKLEEAHIRFGRDVMPWAKLGGESMESQGLKYFLQEFPDFLTRFTPEEHAFIERCREEQTRGERNADSREVGHRAGMD
jgi:hypothetical protein